MKAKRWIAAFDSHGDKIDPDCRRAFLEFCKHWKPHIRIHGGDWVDLTALRRGASDEEKNEGIKADIEAGMDFLREFDVQVLLWGNHDQRLIRGIRTGCGRLREYSEMLYETVLDRLGHRVQHIPYGKRRGVYQLGNYRVIHGYHSGIYAARQAAAVYGNVLMGHVHCNAIFDSPSLDAATGISVGCMCDLDLEYTEAQPNTLRWSHGWAYGLTTEHETVIWLAKKVNGNWVLPSEMTMI